MHTCKGGTRYYYLDATIPVGTNGRYCKLVQPCNMQNIGKKIIKIIFIDCLIWKEVKVLRWLPNIIFYLSKNAFDRTIGIIKINKF